MTTVAPPAALQKRKNRVRWFAVGALGGRDATAAPRRAPSNGQRQQFNSAQSEYQHGERHVIVIEPIPYKHGALPLTALLINVSLTAVSELISRNNSLVSRVVAKTRPNISWFAAGIRHASPNSRAAPERWRQRPD
jgi:hypothetical protein